MKKLIIIVAAVIVAGIVAVNIYLAVMGRPIDENAKNSIVVTIEEGSGTASIATQLKDEDLIRSEFAFKLKSKLSFRDGKYQAGAYAFTRAMSMNEMQKQIASGETAGKTFQVLEGMTIDKVAEQLSGQGICSKEDFYHEVEHGSFDYDFMKYLPEGATRLEGFMFPNTYEVAISAGAHDVIDIMLRETEKVLEEGDYEAKAKEEGSNIYDIITVASIIEREASLAEDKPKVASVIYNRLDTGMYLQMDSIIAYITKEEKIKATYGDINVASDYNPYKNYGLPPGPICSPGKESIEAALTPSKTDYLFFVTTPDMDGSLAFSKTYEAFLKDKEAFDEAYREFIKENPDKE